MEVVLTREEGKKEPKTTSIEARNLFAFNGTFHFLIYHYECHAALPWA